MTLRDQLQSDAAESRAIAAKFSSQASGFRTIAASHDQEADGSTGAKRIMHESQAKSFREHASIAERDAERWEIYAKRLEGM